MESKQVLLVVGGDERQGYVAAKLAKRFLVEAVGVPVQNEEVRVLSPDLQQVTPYDGLVLPIPASVDDKTVYAPHEKTPLFLETLVPYAKNDALVFGGRCTASLQRYFAAAGLSVVDYLQREELCLKNAISTAEGAIQIAMEETDRALYQMTGLILGYGRIGTALALRLQGLCKKVTVCARDAESRARAQLHGIPCVSMEQLDEAVQHADLIWNTVPALVLNRNMLQRMRGDTLVVDLASKPGGTDFLAAEEFGIRVVWALSLPPIVRH